MSRTSRAIKGTLTSFLQNGLHIVLQAALVPLVLHIAGRETLGAYAILMQAIAYLALADLGFSVATNRFLAQAYGHDDGGLRFSQVMGTARTFVFFSNIAFAVLCFLLSVWIGPLLALSAAVKTQAQLGLYILAVWSVLRTPLAVYGAGLIATQNLATVSVIGILGNTARLFLSLALIAVGLGLVGLMLATILAELLTMSLQTRFFHRYYGQIRLSWGISDRRLFKEMFRFGTKALLINISAMLVFQTDNLVVGYLFGAAAVSIYYATQMPATLLYHMVLRVADNAAPAINELYARKMIDSLRNSFLRLHRYSLILILPVALSILFLIKSLISLWVGPGQFGGNLMVIALAIFAMVITVEHCSVIFVLATGQIKVLSLLAITEGIVNLTLSLLLGHYWGLAGVMWATVIANLPASIYKHWRAQRDLGIHFRDYITIVVQPLLWPFVVSITILLILSSQLQFISWLNLIITALTFGLAYSVMCYFLSIEDYERSWLKTMIITVFGLRKQLSMTIL
jgi:O-antigen/teichoic acid export membrane protein